MATIDSGLPSAAGRTPGVPALMRLGSTTNVFLLVALMIAVYAIIQRPEMVATVLFGAPALLLAGVPGLRLVALLAIIFLAPFAAFVKAFTGLVFAPAVLDAAMIVITILVLLERLQTKSLLMRRSDLLVVAVLALGLVQVANPLGPDWMTALYGYRFFILPMLGYFIGRYGIRSAQQIRVCLITMMLSGIVVSTYGLKQSFGLNEYDLTIINSTTGDPSSYTSLGEQRIFSTMSSPAHLAYFMVELILIIAARYTVIGFDWRLLLPLGLYTTALLLTIVRTGWFGVLSGVVTVVVISTFFTPSKIKISVIRRLFILMSILTIVIAIPSVALSESKAFGMRLSSMINPMEERHFSDRVTSWFDTIIPAITTNPFGYGVGSDSTVESAQFYAHNGFFYVAIELGVAGLILVIFLLAWSFFLCLNLARRSHDTMIRLSAVCCAAWVAATCVEGLFGALIEVYPVNLYFWLLLGSLAGLTPQTIRPRSPHDVTVVRNSQRLHGTVTTSGQES